MPPTLLRCSGGLGSEFHQPGSGVPSPPGSGVGPVAPASPASAAGSHWLPSVRRVTSLSPHFRGGGTRPGGRRGTSCRTPLASAPVFHAQRRQPERSHPTHI